MGFRARNHPQKLPFPARRVPIVPATVFRQQRRQNPSREQFSCPVAGSVDPASIACEDAHPCKPTNLSAALQIWARCNPMSAATEASDSELERELSNRSRAALEIAPG